MQYTCYFDGATKPNPGNIGLGVVVYDENGKEVISASGNGGYGTNNFGEYSALVWAMELALEAGIKRIKFIGDSNLVIKQVMGFWEVNSPGLMAVHNKAQKLGQQFEWCTLEWVARGNNQRADELSKVGYSLKEPLIVKSKIHKDISNEIRPCNGVLASEKQPAPEKVHIIEEAPAVEQKTANKAVKVVGLRGNKIAFIYSNHVVVLDIKAKHCSCNTFAADNSCEHLKVVTSRLEAS